MTPPSSKGSTDSLRIMCVNDAPVNPKGRYVLYWITSARRTTYNFAIDRAVDLAEELSRPLLIVETLGCDGRWASDRHHAFILQGMADNQKACENAQVRYYPYVEKKSGSVIGLVTAFAKQACAIIADDFPIRSFEEDVSQVAPKVNVCMELVDSNGLMPMRATDRVFPTAYAFRRFLQRTLPEYLPEFPTAHPLRRLKQPRLSRLPSEITGHWPSAKSHLLSGVESSLSDLPINHAVAPVDTRGGSNAAHAALQAFLKKKLPDYPEQRNHPDADATSHLSPYLHFGHISAHEIFRELASTEKWSPSRLSEKSSGKREGWWGMSGAAEAFLDQLITWREVGYNMCCHDEQYDYYESLPDWAKVTLSDHSNDKREHVYTAEQLEHAHTHDRLWNAAQMELVSEGRLHNYMRMLWGKKILEWSPSPQQALKVLIDLNNKYALDGQNPNSYSGIFWVLGRYDRAWGPVRPIFGKIRYMSSENTARKLRLKEYVANYASQDAHATSG